MLAGKYITGKHGKPSTKINLRKDIQTAKNDRHQPINSEIRAEIPVLPLEYQLSENGKKFLLLDSGHGGDDGILIFGRDQAVQLLANSGEWYCV